MASSAFDFEVLNQEEQFRAISLRQARHFLLRVPYHKVSSDSWDTQKCSSGFLSSRAQG